MRLFLTVCALLLLVSVQLKSQALQPEGHFQADSIQIGENVTYVLTFRYPKDLEVVFPDESAAYAPLEYIDRQFFPTRTDSLYSFDSVVYQLTTFELDSIQKLALPVYVVGTDENGKPDSSAIYATADSLFLNRLITQMPDSVDLKTNTEFWLVDLQFNYPYLLIGIAAIVLLGGLILVLFGKQIRNRWLVYKLSKDNKKFHEQFKKAMDAYKHSPNRRRTEETLVVWKKYMESLDRAPYTKMTTKEIVRLPSGHVLQEDLRAIDRSIYGRATHGELIPYFTHLYEHTADRFKQRIEDIKQKKRNG